MCPTILYFRLHMRLLMWVESASSSPWMSTTASGIACGGNNGKATRQCTVCVVNAGVLKTNLVDAFDHGLGEVEPAAGNSYIAEHGLKGCSGCLLEVCHGAGGRKVRHELLDFREYSRIQRLGLARHQRIYDRKGCVCKWCKQGEQLVEDGWYYFEGSIEVHLSFQTQQLQLFVTGEHKCRTVLTGIHNTTIEVAIVHFSVARVSHCCISLG